MASVSSSENQQLLTKMTEYNAFQFNADSLYKFAKSQVNSVSFQLNIPGAYNWSFSLQPYNLYSPGAILSYTDQNGIHQDDAGTSNTYKGSLTGDPTAIVRLLVSAQTVTGFIKTPTETYHINPIGFWIANPSNPNIFLLIKETKFIQPTGTPANTLWCPTNGVESGSNQIIDRGDGTLCIEVAVDCNYEMFSRYGTTNATANVVNNYIMAVDMRYEAELNIRVLVTYINVWQIASPFEGAISAPVAWNNFQNYWNLNNACINRDVAILLKGNGGGGWLGYVEAVGSVCVGRKTGHALIVDVGNTARTIGHELGHWLSALHTSASTCANICYVMCSTPTCAPGGTINMEWGFSPISKNKINTYLTSNDVQFVYYKHDWCLGNATGITGPGRLCVNQQGTYSYNSFLAGAQFPTQSHTLVWTTGPGLSIISTDPIAQTVSIKGTGNNISSWVGVQLALTPWGASHGFGCNNGAPQVKKSVHAGLPLSAGTPNITSYWGPGYPTGSYHYDIGFGTSESAIQYQYSYQVYNVPNPSNQTGVTANINPLIVNVPQGGCFTASVLAGNECGFLTPSQTTNFPVTICFNSPIIKPDGTEVLVAEMGGKTVELLVNNDDLTRMSEQPVPDFKLPVSTFIPWEEAIFPNPANNMLTLQLPYENTTVTVHDVTGRMITAFEFEKGVHNISTEEWQDGLYLLNLQTKTVSSSHRLLIQH